MKNVLDSKEFSGMVHFVAFVYLTRVVLNLVEGKGVDDGSLLLIGVGLVAGMFIRNKLMLVAVAVAMVLVLRVSLVVKEGANCSCPSGTCNQ